MKKYMSGKENHSSTITKKLALDSPLPTNLYCPRNNQDKHSTSSLENNDTKSSVNYTKNLQETNLFTMQNEIA